MRSFVCRRVAGQPDDARTVVMTAKDYDLYCRMLAMRKHGDYQYYYKFGDTDSYTEFTGRYTSRDIADVKAELGHALAENAEAA